MLKCHSTLQTIVLVLCNYIVFTVAVGIVMSDFNSSPLGMPICKTIVNYQINLIYCFGRCGILCSPLYLDCVIVGHGWVQGFKTDCHC